MHTMGRDRGVHTVPGGRAASTARSTGASLPPLVSDDSSEDTVGGAIFCSAASGTLTDPGREQMLNWTASRTSSTTGLADAWRSKTQTQTGQPTMTHTHTTGTCYSRCRIRVRIGTHANEDKHIHTRMDKNAKTQTATYPCVCMPAKSLQVTLRAFAALSVRLPAQPSTLGTSNDALNAALQKQAVRGTNNFTIDGHAECRQTNNDSGVCANACSQYSTPTRCETSLLHRQTALSSVLSNTPVKPPPRYVRVGKAANGGRVTAHGARGTARAQLHDSERALLCVVHQQALRQRRAGSSEDLDRLHGLPRKAGRQWQTTTDDNRRQQTTTDES